MEQNIDNVPKLLLTNLTLGYSCYSFLELYFYSLFNTTFLTRIRKVTELSDTLSVLNKLSKRLLNVY